MRLEEEKPLQISKKKKETTTIYHDEDKPSTVASMTFNNGIGRHSTCSVLFYEKFARGCSEFLGFGHQPNCP
jgi:hypothetical protein